MTVLRPATGVDASATADVRTVAFRDPGGRLLSVGGRLFRIVARSGVQDLTSFLSSKSAESFGKAGRLVHTDVLDPSEAARLLENRAIAAQAHHVDGELILEHEPVPFPSYPYEWPAEMLHAAAALTIDLARALLSEGLGLKDATPYNVLFRGPEPVFVDVLSVERRLPGDPTWLPYGQFLRTFVLPLLANRARGFAPGSILTTRRDGVEPEEMYRWLTVLERLTPPFFTLVSVPTWLTGSRRSREPELYQRRLLKNPEKARYILDVLLRRQQAILKRLSPRTGNTTRWSEYARGGAPYTPEQTDAKQAFVREVLRTCSSRRILDIGCNTGTFSVIGANVGASVVAVDADPIVVGDLWRTASAARLDILPLAVDITRPSPAIGWANNECSSFLRRARGAFDTVLLLAVMHHLLVTERVPLDAIIDLAADLTTDVAIIEFVSPGDSMFRRLTRGRDALFATLTETVFEDACRRRFDIAGRLALPGVDRRLYFLRKKP